MESELEKSRKTGDPRASFIHKSLEGMVGQGQARNGARQAAPAPRLRRGIESLGGLQMSKKGEVPIFFLPLTANKGYEA